LRKEAIVVMPDASAQVKIEAVREFGGTVDLIDVRRVSRADRIRELADRHPDAYVASAYDDPWVIEGNSSLGIELAATPRPFDWVVAPIGGGGLTSGLIQGLTQAGARASVIGAEPLAGNDAARSLRCGRIVPNESEPDTIADGARTVSVGHHNWRILRDGLTDIIEVSEDRIAEAVRLLFLLANLKAEPTGALGVGALLTAPERFRNQSICCVVSGGNVDPGVFSKILSGG
jgi:threonine dehydratase